MQQQSGGTASAELCENCHKRPGLPYTLYDTRQVRTDKSTSYNTMGTVRTTTTTTTYQLVDLETVMLCRECVRRRTQPVSLQIGCLGFWLIFGVGFTIVFVQGWIQDIQTHPRGNVGLYLTEAGFIAVLLVLPLLIGIFGEVGRYFRSDKATREAIQDRIAERDESGERLAAHIRSRANRARGIIAFTPKGYQALRPREPLSGKRTR